MIESDKITCKTIIKYMSNSKIGLAVYCVWCPMATVVCNTVVLKTLAE